MGITTDQIDGITNGNVVSTNGDKIGGIGQVYLDDNTGEPNWVTVKTGLFGTSESFVPLDGADLRGGDIVVKYDKATIKDAPRVDADGSISPEEEDALYSYYGLGGTSAGYTTDTDRDYATTGTTGTDRDYTATGTTDTDYATTGNVDLDDNTRGTKGRDVSGPETDDAMTLSEERVEVGTQRREAGRARLRKYVVTENVTKTVPVEREEVRIEREPITEANRGAAESGPEISEEEHEVVLHEERPVVEKEAVPVERIRLDTETVTDDVTVNEEVRKERVDTDVDEDLPRR
jgi:uncharacterized protein (TIGR02271 family)